MRDIALTLFVAGLLPFALRRPEIGAYLWAWISLMNPHKLTWGFAFSLPFAQVIAAVTLLGLLFSRKRQPFPVNAGTVALVMLVFWMTVTSFFAVNSQEIVWDRWIFVVKIHLMLFATIMLLHGRTQIDRLIWVIVISIGFFGVKGGLWTLLTGGGGRVWGPPGGMVADNNSLAVAMIMIFPLMYYLWQTAERSLIKHLLLLSIVLVGFAILGSQSRGAFLGLFAMAVMLGLKSRHPVRISILLLTLLALAIGFMPDSWTLRMNTLDAYGEDSSAMSRLYTWQTLWNAAIANPLTGVGFAADTQKVFSLYAPTSGYFADFRGGVWVAHSIYFQALGEHGFPGLLLYLTIWIWTWRAAGRLISESRAMSDFENWVPQLMKMCQVSIIGFCVGGAFLSLMHLDLSFYLLAIVVLVDRAIRAKKDRQRGELELNATHNDRLRA